MRKYIIAILTIITLFTVALNLHGDDELIQSDLETHLDIEAAVELALDYSPEIKAKNQAIYAARAGIDEADASIYYPNLGLSASATYIDIVPEQTFSSAPFTAELGASLSYPIYQGGLRLSQADLAATQLQIAIIDQHKQTQEVIYNSKIAFLGVLITEKVYEIQKISYDLNAQMEEDMRTNYENGLVSEFDYNRTAIGVQMAEPELIAAEQQLITAKNNLFMQIGYPMIVDEDSISNDIVIIGDIDTTMLDTSIDEAVDLALENNPDIKMLALNVEILNHTRDMTRSARLPFITAFASATMQITQSMVMGGSSDTSSMPCVSLADLSTCDIIDSISSMTSSSIGLGDYDDVYNFVVGIQIDYDLGNLIFPNSSVDAQLDSIDAQISQLQHNLDAVKNATRMGIITYYLSMSQAYENLDLRERTVELSQENLDMALRRYEMGILSYLDYKDVEVSYLNAVLLLLNEKYTFCESKMNVLKAIGNMELEQ